MKVVLANLLALLFMCTCACVFYVLTRLESRLEKHSLGFRTPWGASARPGRLDLPPKTFRALLAVPVAQKLLFGNAVDVHNLSGQGEQLDSFRDNARSRLSANNRRSREDPLRLSDLVEDGVFWSEQLETQVPVGFTEEHTRNWRARTRGHPIVSLEPGCGRISNRLATFSDGTKACVRYGINADQVQGETLAYYLAALLGIPNLPPLALSQLNLESEQWAAVKGSVASLQWTGKAVVSLTEWIANLTGVVTPAPLRQEGKGLHPLREELENKTLEELLELVQWSDLILFDYLTANFDRLVSNLFSLQWDSRVMERDTSNLHRTPDGDLVFIDNEAGLVHGYRVLDMWEKYHSALMGSVCVFRRRTAQRVIELHRLKDARTRLLQLYQDNEPLAPELGFLSDEHAGILQNRIDRLYRHILHCKGKYSQL
ncbi:four-jointed box protein 1 [Anguilla rostrata]|uniref:four-jointed box protein 1 n=1 Tax=Anguilla rostrata TaxID=7938 RepID=UPI0030CF4827